MRREPRNYLWDVREGYASIDKSLFLASLPMWITLLMPSLP